MIITHTSPWFLDREIHQLVFYSWYFKAISQELAEDLLMQPPNHYGSFLVHKSKSDLDCYAFSIKETKKWYTSKYKLHSGGYFIQKQMGFKTIPQLRSCMLSR